MIKESDQIYLKVVVAGQSSAGKTSLLTRQSINDFTQNYCATIGIDFRVKTYTVGDISVKARLWDLAGGQRFQSSIASSYYKGANAILLCFDLNDHQSFKQLESWIELLKSKNINVAKNYLIGCKRDLQHKVFADQILLFAQKHQLTYFQTSAKTNEGVNECFQFIIKECMPSKLQQIAFERVQLHKKLTEKQASWIMKTCF